METVNLSETFEEKETKALILGKKIKLKIIN